MLMKHGNRQTRVCRAALKKEIYYLGLVCFRNTYRPQQSGYRFSKVFQNVFCYLMHCTLSLCDVYVAFFAYWILRCNRPISRWINVECSSALLALLYTSMS